MKILKYPLSLLVLWALYYLIPLPYRLLWQPDETRYAEISRELLATGDWVVPHLLGIRYFEKPIAGYWINNLSQLIFGQNNLGVRFGAVFSITVTACMVAWLTYRLWQDKRSALLAAVIYLTCLLVYGVGTYAVLDPMIAMWLCAAMCSFWYASQSTTWGGKLLGYLALGIACGMGVMTKGFLALVVPVISVLPWMIAEKRWKEVLLYGPLAVLSAVLVTLPWALLIAQREPDFWHYFFWVEHIQRFAAADAQHKAPFWYYLPMLILGTLPWLGFLPGALRLGWQGRKQNTGTIYLLGWVVMPLLFFSLAKGKLLTYILPCYAPLAILLARYVLQSVQERAGALRANGVINLLFGIVGLLAAVLVLAPIGLSKSPLYAPHEFGKVLAAVAVFFSWALLGYLSWQQGGRRWWLATFCPLMLALLVGVAIPEKVINAKQPQAMIEQVRTELKQSRYILANNAGIATAVAWEMQRSDITLYDRRGELAWGMGFADSASRFVAREAFPDWLMTHRSEGNITLVLLMSDHDTLADLGLPPPDLVHTQGRFTVVEYHPQ